MGSKRRSLTRVGALAAGVLLGACGQPDPPTLVSLEVWEGSLANPAMPVLQRRIEAMPDGGFVLRRDTLHLARVTLLTSGQAGRCLFRPFDYSWAPAGREYECHTEVQDGPMTIDVPFGTWARDLVGVSDFYLTVQLIEHGTGRQQVSIYDTRRYAVRFQ